MSPKKFILFSFNKGRIDMINIEHQNMQFAANITHDLRNPLAGIKITAQVLQQHASSPDDERLLQNIVNTTNHLSGIIDHILKMSKESAKAETTDAFSFNTLIVDVIELLSLSAEAKNLTLYADLSEDIMVMADRYRCFRILLNLVENAIKYTKKGHILIRYAIQNDRITVEVEDTGIGITKKQQAEIFKCYTQLETGCLKADGIGLGLHLALVFAQQMGGKIAVKSKKNKGSVFSFSFQSLITH